MNQPKGETHRARSGSYQTQSFHGPLHTEKTCITSGTLMCNIIRVLPTWDASLNFDVLCFYWDFIM